MDDVYVAAQKRADELREELKTLNDYIDLHRRARHLLGLDSRAHKENFMSDTPEVGELGSHVERAPASESHVKRPRTTDNPKPADVVEAARIIIWDSGHPMSRRDLHSALIGMGLEVKGADPIKALGTMLWRADHQLAQLKGLGYWLKDKPYEPAGYDPDEFFDTSTRGES